MKRWIVILIISIMGLSGETLVYADGDPYVLQKELAEVQSRVSNTSNNTGITPAQSMRNEAIQRAAIVYGAQSGLYYRWQQIQTLLLQRNELLSKVFNFGSMYLDDGLVQPPVLDMSSNVTDISNSGQVRELENNVYRVLIPAAFKSRPITWQAFLLPDSLSAPPSPRTALLPQNTYEKQLWSYYIQKGWSQGVSEANSEFETRLDALNNAYQGMVLYTMLAMRGMVAPPQIVKTTQAVQSASDGQKMAVGINEQVISSKSYFVAEPNHWKPVFYDHSFASFSRFSLKGYVK